MVAAGMNNWHRFNNTAELDRALAHHLAQRLTEDIARYGDASLAVSGGRTPTGMFGQLSRCDLDWCDHYKKTLFDFDTYRRPEVYGRITGQKGVVPGPEGN